MHTIQLHDDCLADHLSQLNDKSLFKQDVAYVNGEWIKAKLGKTFEVTGRPRYPPHPTSSIADSLPFRPFNRQDNRHLPRI